jgi:hypothetical protein
MPLSVCWKHASASAGATFAPPRGADLTARQRGPRNCGPPAPSTQRTVVQFVAIVKHLSEVAGAPEAAKISGGWHG